MQMTESMACHTLSVTQTRDTLPESIQTAQQWSNYSINIERISLRIVQPFFDRHLIFRKPLVVKRVLRSDKFDNCDALHNVLNNIEFRFVACCCMAQVQFDLSVVL